MGKSYKYGYLKIKETYKYKYFWIKKFYKYRYFKIEKTHEYEYSQIEKFYKYRYFRIEKSYRYKYSTNLVINKTHNTNKGLSIFYNIDNKQISFLILLKTSYLKIQ